MSMDRASQILSIIWLPFRNRLLTSAHADYVLKCLAVENEPLAWYMFAQEKDRVYRRQMLSHDTFLKEVAVKYEPLAWYMIKEDQECKKELLEKIVGHS